MDKRAKILAAALKLLVEQGFHSTPTSAIAKAAGVANGTLFHYFKTKDELILGLYADIKKDSLRKILQGIEGQQSVKAKVKTIWYNSINWSITEKEKHNFKQQFMHSPYATQLSQEDLEEELKLFSDMIKEGIEKKILKDIPIDLIYHITHYQMLAIVSYLNLNPHLIEDADFYELAFELFWDNIKRV
ncbi:TetR/AcrR family transcriptional regulator [Flexithrix dorotheae]|uniref:TetR/AcrR family transcriptional regulator n=1 Tax=Flexithrix dorotheae TaxID=70993 RepID=UPI0003780C70|nr:TetR/AcrR family transcriptional regulator [Flexithrix dorotheae]